MTAGNSAKRIRGEDLVVCTTERPGWVAGNQRLPGIGEEVYCVGGAGVVSAVLGKTGDGSRLLEIRLTEPGAKPFFAAASNVLVAPA
ncbi:MAG TPA: hypothetical protein VFX98_02310 [Longimicrobiaceae bacterium]|nr:hypothetical protein [Longimicrobiaceae bacterium]